MVGVESSMALVRVRRRRACSGYGWDVASAAELARGLD